MNTRISSSIVAGLLALAACGLVSCKQKAETAETQGTLSALAHPSEKYVVRGIIEALPDPADPRTQLMIHHEHIPDFKGKDGKVHVYDDGTTGMKAMIMPFDTLGPDVVLDQFQVGDKIEFVLHVAREPRMSMAIMKMTKLPPDTVIRFENKSEP